MLSFFIKKAFFDGWDHLFTLVLLNFVFLALTVAGIFLPGLCSAGSPGFFLVLAAVILAAAIWWSLCIHGLMAVADNGSFTFREIPSLLRKALLPGIQYGGLCLLIVLALAEGLPFYLSRGGLVGAFAAGVLLWGSVFFLLAFQWYLPLRVRFGGGLRKNLRKCFVFFFDNALFSVFIFFYNLAGAAISVFSALLVPGFAGMALGIDDALKLRAYKYDWLEAHPASVPGGARRRDIPWDELLAEEKELVGKRTLRNMIFPWKE